MQAIARERKAHAPISELTKNQSARCERVAAYTGRLANPVT
jgi:hypothetical protein